MDACGCVLVGGCVYMLMCLCMVCLYVNGCMFVPLRGMFSPGKPRPLFQNGLGCS